MREPQQLSAEDLVQHHVSKADHVLLVNPPVEETRYNWVRWNQPLDLLRIASFLRDTIRCHVSLLDCMQPDQNWKVPSEWLPGARRYQTVAGEDYPMRRFGKPYSAVTERLRPGGRPSGISQVWITSLCHYWFESVAQVCRTAREAQPDIQIVVLGAYPRFALSHAQARCCADYLVPDGRDLNGERGAFDLYGRNRPPFTAVTVQSATAVDDVRRSVAAGVLDVAIFGDNVLCAGAEHFLRLFRDTCDCHDNLRFHLICGLYPEDVTPDVAQILAERKVAEAHFEESDKELEVNVDAYLRLKRLLTGAGIDWPSDKFSGFVWIGRPRETLETIVSNSFKVLDILGSLILKPFTPTPGSATHSEYHGYLERVLQKNLSPHFFPFAELNGISRSEYHDVYRMAAFLNEKVRNRSFDFLNGTIGSRLLRDSLKKEVWNLGPSTLRVID